METLEVVNYTSKLLEDLYVLQTQEVLCDVYLSSENGRIPCHKVVLMAASPYLKKRLSDTTQDQDVIMFRNESLELIQSTVKFIYTGKLEVCNETIEQFENLLTELELTQALETFRKYKANNSEVDIESLSDKTIKSHTENISPETGGNKPGASQMSDKPKVHISISKNRRKIKVPQKRCVSVPEKVAVECEESVETPPLKKRRGRPSVKTKSVVSEKTKGSAKNKLKSNAKLKLALSKKANSKTGKRKTSGYKINIDKMTLECNDMSSDKSEEVNDNKSKAKADEAQSDYSESDDHASDLNDEETDKLDTNVTAVQQGKRRKRTGDGTSGRKRSSYRRCRQKDFPCSLCSKVLSSHKRLVFHEFSKHGTPYDKERYSMFPCTEQDCSYVAADRRSLDTHVKSRHGVDRPHICEFCGKGFKLPNVLATHLNIHTGKKIWKCQECGETFNQQSGLDIHIKRHHVGEASWGELCHLCSEKFLLKSELAWHLFKNHDLPLPERYKAYICDICNYLTKSSQDLQRHQNAHKGIKQFACPVCQKSCSTKSELKRHMSFHGEKKFKCTYEGCSYACVDSIGLGKHIKLMHTHKNYKPFVCPVCPYRTGVKGNVDKHIRTVHNLEVVTKHTIQLKMKYANFQSGDIITKEGRLVATAQQRKRLQQCTPQGDNVIPNFDIVVSPVDVRSQLKDNVDKEVEQAAEGIVKAYMSEEQTENNVVTVAREEILDGGNDGTDNEERVVTCAENVIPLSNYVYIHGTQSDIGNVAMVPQDLRMLPSNHSSTQAELYQVQQTGLYMGQKINYPE